MPSRSCERGGVAGRPRPTEAQLAELAGFDVDVVALEALLLARPADADEPPGDARRRRLAQVEGMVEAAMHDMHLVPMRRLDPAKQLAARERACADDERRTPDLLGETDRARPVKLVRTVNGHAVACAGERARDHRDLGEVRAEMRVIVAKRLRNRRATTQAHGTVDPVKTSERADPAAILVASRRVLRNAPGRAIASATMAPSRPKTPSRRTKRVRSPSRTSSGSASGPSQPRREIRCTSTPCRSSARISRRMRLWLMAG